jgi:two-component system OmpR family response regulator
MRLGLAEKERVLNLQNQGGPPTQARDDDPTRRRIALVEDDEVISGNYADLLRLLGFAVDAYRTKEAALRGLAGPLPALVLIDITLNGERDAGFEVCLELRRRSKTTPVIFLSSHEGELDKASGFRLGADDYITKDVSLDFLAIRIEALFRRLDAWKLEGSGQTLSAVRRSEASGDHLVFDSGSSTVTWRNHPLRMTLTQYWMLKELHAAAGQPRSYDQLMRAANLVVEDNTVSAHIKTIREAFKEVDPEFDRLRTERGRGYRWVSA